MEIWKDIKGYKGHYQVSNFGRVRSLDRKVTHKNNRSFLIKGRILSNRPNGRGYLFVDLWINNKAKMFQVHRLVAMHFLPAPKKHQTDVNHKNSIRSDNHADNLEWATRSQNMRHAVKHGYCNSDNKNWNPDTNPNLLAKTNPNKAKKLNHEIVKTMRLMREQGLTYKQIANTFGVSRQMASGICRGKFWR